MNRHETMHNKTQFNKLAFWHNRIEFYRITFSMKIPFTLLILVALCSCGGSLSDEQRKKIKEDMKQHQIVRISDAEITAAAFENGREAMRAINKNDKALSDSLKHYCTIRWIVPGSKNAHEVETQLIEAYLESSINGGMEDNVQKIGADSLLYTKPVTEKLADGSEIVKGMWSIQFAKKQLILSMKK